MYASVTILALSGFFVGAVPVSPAWQADYDLARKLGRESHKPLAVFIASGKSGWNNLSKEGKLGKETSFVLAAEYVCVYLDTNQKAAKRLATAFEVPDGAGLILSDRTGAVQAFRHEGELADQELLRQLKRYADPERIVRTTEGNSIERLSYYAPEDSPAQYYDYVQPAPYYRSFGGGGRSC
jgi:hypothetical protein